VIVTFSDLKMVCFNSHVFETWMNGGMHEGMGFTSTVWGL